MFEVVYLFGENLDMKLPSKVYAVDRMTETFLIVDGWGKFHWVPMKNCTLKSEWELENGKLDGDDEPEEETKNTTEGYWDDPLIINLGEDFSEALKKHMQDRHLRGLYG